MRRATQQPFRSLVGGALILACGAAANPSAGAQDAIQESALVSAQDAAQDAVQVSIPVVLEDRSGGHGQPMPVRLGLPFARGQLDDALALEFDAQATVVPASSEVLSRWPDGSVRWLAVDLIPPGQGAGMSLAGVLQDRSSPDPLPGILEVRPPHSGRPLSIVNGQLELQVGVGSGELFHLLAPRGGLRSPIRSSLSSQSQSFYQAAYSSNRVVVEHQDELSVTVVRRDTYEAFDGRDIFLLTTRATVWRGFGGVRLQQSLDVLAGVHRIQDWTLELSLDAPPLDADLVFGDGQRHLLSGDATVIQESWDQVRIRGTSQARSQPVVYEMADLTVGLRHFWQKAPSALLRAGDDLLFSLCPNVGGQAVAMEEGFGATRELWMFLGDAVPADAAETARVIDAPPRMRAHADWYVASGVFGGLREPVAGIDDELELRHGESAVEILDRWDLDPDHHYGVHHYGDFFDREHSLAYWGALQQEYDPAFVALIGSIRDGDLELFDRALDMAWHYADADVSWYGGVYQHRATSHHVESWIAGLFGDSFQSECHTSGLYDGSLDSVWRWVDQHYGANYQQDLEDWVNLEVKHGAEGPELEDRLFHMVGHNLVQEIAEDLGLGGSGTVYDYAAAIALDPRAQARGYADPVADFQPFFDLHGGSWAEFPSFHVDDHPVPVQRHQGGHSLAQGLALAHLMSGEPRLREVALRIGRHHAEELVPWEVDHAIELRTAGTEPLPARRLGWPLINLVMLLTMTEGMAEEEGLHKAMEVAATSCAEELALVDPLRLDSSIQAGVMLEGLADWYRLSFDPDTKDKLVEVAQHWALHHYDWNEHAFLHRVSDPLSAMSGMTGLVIYGIAFANRLEPHGEVGSVVQDAWANLPRKTSYAKAYGMLYRGALRLQGWVH